MEILHEVRGSWRLPWHWHTLAQNSLLSTIEQGRKHIFPDEATVISLLARAKLHLNYAKNVQTTTVKVVMRWVVILSSGPFSKNLSHINPHLLMLLSTLPVSAPASSYATSGQGYLFLSPFSCSLICVFWCWDQAHSFVHAGYTLSIERWYLHPILILYPLGFWQLTG